MILIQIERGPASFDNDLVCEKYNDGAVGKASKVSLECIYPVMVCRGRGALVWQTQSDAQHGGREVRVRGQVPAVVVRCQAYGTGLAGSLYPCR